jgi:nitronate monooxygenase
VALRTRLTDQWGLLHPIINAPMAAAAGGVLAAAVTRAGGLGLIGGGYGDPAWLEREFAAAGNASVGCGFITWRLAERPQLLEAALAHAPRAIFLSFDDPGPYSAAIKAAGALLICQVQTLDDARRALDAGADLIVAQGAEAGGHGDRRATLTLTPEVADLLAARSPQTLLAAAGGIADGRTLAAALMLGADGAVVGSRLWASREALVSPRMHAAALAADGDGTIRSTVMDLARGFRWPARFTARVLKNAFTDRWHGHESELAASRAPGEAWGRAWAEGDPDGANTFVGEAAGLLHDIRPAGDLIEAMAADAARLLRDGASLTR